VDTKLVGDISEQTIILESLKRGYGVLKPIGDRLPYDLALDVKGRILKVQSKTAYFSELASRFVVNTTRSCTNRKVYLAKPYEDGDFDFCLAVVSGTSVVYVLPWNFFKQYARCILINEGEPGQRALDSEQFRNAWHLLETNGPP
jgi:hypothetical protein